MNFRFVIATSAESNMSLVTTVTCLALSIKSFPLIRVNVYEMARGVGEERGTKRKESEEEWGGRRQVKHLEKKSVTFCYYRTPRVHKAVSQRFACRRVNVKRISGKFSGGHGKS